MDRTIKAARYLKIAEDLKLKILSKIYKPGELLPSESVLLSRYQTSRITIRGAINQLEKEGYIYTKAGVGSFVKDTHNNRYKINLRLESILDNGYKHIELLNAKIIEPDIDLVYALKIPKDHKVIFIEWRIFNHLKQVAYNRRYIPYIKNLPIYEGDLTYKSLRDMLKKVPGEGYERIVIKESKDNALLSGKMDILENDILVLKEHIIHDDTHTPLGLDQLYILANECTFVGEARI